MPSSANAIKVRSSHEYVNGAGILGLPQATTANEPVTLVQLQGLLEANKFTEAETVSTANINLAAPGATLNGYTFVNAGSDQFLARTQTVQSENGTYVWNGAAVPATRAPGSNTSAELTGEIVKVTQGTDAGTQWRQTTANPTIGTSNIVYASDQNAAPASSTTVSGTIRQGTQAEINSKTAGVAVTGETLGNSVFAHRSYKADFGDGTATTYTITHNLATEDIIVQFRETAGTPKKPVGIAWESNSGAPTNAIDIRIDGTAPASGSLRVLIIAV